MMIIRCNVLEIEHNIKNIDTFASENKVTTN